MADYMVAHITTKARGRTSQLKGANDAHDIG
jgi:hypothetical protein